MVEKIYSVREIPRMRRSEQVAPKVTEAAVKFLIETFDKPNRGATFWLEALPLLYKRAIAQAKGNFTDPEKLLIVKAVKRIGFEPSAANAGRSLYAVCEDAIKYLGLIEKVDEEKLLLKLKELHPFDAACLEIWAAAFWLGNGKLKIEDYVR